MEQTLNDIEIILVDDGSSDNSGIICDEYAKVDRRICVIHHRENEGLSSARNDGINTATAPYILFVDGDDWIETQLCEKAFLLLQENKADLVLFGFKRVFENGLTENVTGNYRQGIITEAEVLSFNVNIWDAAWVGLYHRDAFKDLRYPTGKYYEDTGTSHRLIHAAERICFLKECLYNYRVGREGSITTSQETKDHPDRIEMRLLRIKDFLNWGYNEYAQKDTLFLLTHFGEVVDPEIVEELIRKDSVSRFLSWKQKVMLKAYKVSPKIFHAACIITGRRSK